MTRRLIIECGVAQTRAALLIDDKVWSFWFGAARGDEAADHYPLAGRKFAGKVLRIDSALSAAFIHFGDSVDGFLPMTKANASHCVEGAMMCVEIKSPSRQQKGAMLRFVEPLGPTEAPGRLPPFLDPALEAVQGLGLEFDEIVINDGEAKKFLTEHGIQNVSHDTHRLSLFGRYAVDAELDAVFHRYVSLAGGGSLAVDETQALTAIDVDTGGLTASSSARLREKVALAAASEAVRQISLRNIGGHVVIDFPKIKGEAGRKHVQEHLHKELSRLDKVSAASFSKSGLFTFVAPHRASSLIERYTEDGCSEPHAGRRFTVGFLARRAIVELENCLRAAPSSQVALTLGAELHDYLNSHLHWDERLRAKYGSRFEITLNATGEERGYDLSEQR